MPKPRKRVPAANVLRRATALELRLAGKSYEAIGEALGVSQQAAHELVQKTLDAMIREPAEGVLALELSRLDGMLDEHYANACNGGLAATDRVLAIMARRARLLGLDKQTDAPSVVVAAHDGPDLSKLTPDALQAYWRIMASAARTDDERARYEAAAAALSPREPT